VTIKPERPTHPSISIIVPTHNEEAGIAVTYRAIAAELDRTGCPWEIVVVDDGSRDNTVGVWRGLMATDARLGLVTFTRNYGKENALLAGFTHVQGDVTIPMDADLQDPPEVIPAFLERWRAGFDMVYGVRRHRDESFFKKLSATLHYRLLNALSPIHIPEEAGDFRLLDRSVVQDLLKLPERDRYHKGLYAWVGHKSCAVLYDRPARLIGEASQSFRKLLTLAFDGIISFSAAPLQFLLWIGLASCGIAVLYACYLLTQVLILHGPTPAGYPTLLCFILFFGGIQMTALGLIGEYLARIYREVKQRPPYLLAEVTLGKPQGASAPNAHQA
jgi:glycosyltransferase involved in cell wall biosynthesis